MHYDSVRVRVLTWCVLLYTVVVRRNPSGLTNLSSHNVIMRPPTHTHQPSYTQGFVAASYWGFHFSRTLSSRGPSNPSPGGNLFSTLLAESDGGTPSFAGDTTVRAEACRVWRAWHGRGRTGGARESRCHAGHTKT